MGKAFKRRAADEPCVGHLKSDYRLERNFYKGVVGDSINLILAAAAFNFKRMINKWESSPFGFLLLRQFASLYFSSGWTEFCWASSCYLVLLFLYWAINSGLDK
jgi:hypothetical protein